MRQLVLTLGFVLSAVILGLAITYYIYWYYNKYSCDRYPNFWCFNDWRCNGETEPRYQYPAKYLYCGLGNKDFCKDPVNKTHPACACNIALQENNCLPAACTCQWSQGGSGMNLGECGLEYCGNGDTANCRP